MSVYAQTVALQKCKNEANFCTMKEISATFALANGKRPGQKAKRKIFLKKVSKKFGGYYKKVLSLHHFRAEKKERKNNKNEIIEKYRDKVVRNGKCSNALNNEVRVTSIKRNRHKRRAKERP